MRPLQEGIPPNGYDFRKPRLRTYIVPYFERNEETRKIIWATFSWKTWFRGWLPEHIVRWLNAIDIAMAIHNRQQLGDWWVVPEGYECDVIRKQPLETGDPLQQYETIGFKMTHKEKMQTNKGKYRIS